MKWVQDFWNEHGERIIFMLAATAFGACFYFIDEMRGEAKAILVGVAMLCYNKARSPRNGKPAPPPPVDK